MKINFLILLMLSILFFNNCATTHMKELTAVASPGQNTDPDGAVVSEKMHMVSMSEYKEIPYMGDNAIFNINIENGGEEPITIGNENILIIFEGHDKKRTVKTLDVLSATEFMNDVEYKYREGIRNDMSQMVNAGPLGPKGSVAAEYALSARVEKFRAESEKAMEKNKRMKKLREISPDLFLNQRTIMPRESIGALISYRTNKIPRRIAGDIKIKVSIDGEEHGFVFAQK